MAPIAATETARTDPEAELLFYAALGDPTAENLRPAYHALRDRAPALLLEDGTLVLSGHAGCDAALRHRALGKGSDMLGFQFTGLPPERLEELMSNVADSMIFANPPDHTRLRRLVSSAFTGRHVQELRGAVRERTAALLDRLADGPGTDFMTTVALPLPLNVIGDLLGIPDSDRAVVLPLAGSIGAVVSPDSTPEALADAVEATRAITDYITDLLAHKRLHPGDDLLSRLARSAEEDALRPEEVVSTAILLFGAGFETTTNLLGNGLHALLDNPAELAALRADRSLMPTAIEELLRYDGTVQIDARTVLEPAVLQGVNLEPGTMVITLLGAANHDPARFTDPDRLDLSRTDNPHLSFAIGIHFCLGAHLARLEADIVFTQLLDRFPHLERTTPPTRRSGLALRGFTHYPLTTAPA
ncbi:cytochrome P450 [Actinocorallia longicatena]|uniref:Cytochrome P450 n=1 Tax=Actinocorallia longicatena TaxID=111803 RepID=A0ABP6Q731_9ACTN